MKRFNTRFFYGIFVACSATLFTACDDVKEGDRYIDMGEITADRTVLLEDFTGQNCLNCPDAHEVIDQLVEQYGDKLIPVSIHCGDFGVPVRITNFERGRIGLMTDEGNTILTSYPINSFPMGVVDMGSPITFDLWATAVRNELSKPTDITIQLKAEFVPDAEQPEEGYAGNIQVTADVISSDDKNAQIQFWVLEDGIIAQQRWHGETVQEYTHNNVFRAQIFSGVRGENISLEKGIDKSVTGEIATRWTDKERWEVKNISVVAYVSDGTGVLQAARTYLFPKAEEGKEVKR